MTLAVLSFFRNSAWGQAQRFLRQVADLNRALSGCAHLRVVAVYGDCEDHTREILMLHATTHTLSLQLVECNHGGPWFGSTEDPARFEALSKVGNAGFEAIRQTDDYVLYVESDLLWEPDVVLKLLDRLDEQHDLVAPLVFAGPSFYDIFAFRKNGVRFSPSWPYHAELQHDGSLTPVDSVGSCFVMKGAVARACRMAPGGVLPSFCEDAWRQGFRVAVDPALSIKHP